MPKSGQPESEIFQQLGAEEGCRRLSRAFYTRVANDTVLKPLFPGKSLRCATEEFAAFLIQFFGGGDSQTQYRWWLSLRESHARFQISEEQRLAWLRHMTEALRETVSDDAAREALLDFFTSTSSGVVGRNGTNPSHPELADLWNRQVRLEGLVRSIAAGRDQEAIAASEEFANRPSVFVGILARMMETRREDLVSFVAAQIEKNPDLVRHQFNGRPLLHHASGAGCLSAIQEILKHGVDPNTLDSGGHTALYRLAGCDGPDSATIVKILVQAGASVDLDNGVQRATPLHEAARWGNLVVARALIESGANIAARDKRGKTPLDRAVKGRRIRVVDLLGGERNAG